MKKLSDRAKQAERSYERELVEIFNELKQQDPEIAEAALCLYEGNKTTAAKFITTQVAALGEISPLYALDNGQREDVLVLMRRLEEGIFS